ncbi:MAG: putative sulfate exporter family transporter [Gemmatimonadota bacterium]
MPPSAVQDPGIPSSTVPGLALTAALGVVAWGIALGVGRMYPRAGVDAVVLAILAGVIVRALWHPAPWALPGISVAARQVLEIAIVLLGVATDARWMARAGAGLAVAIALTTSLALGAGLLWGRVFGLPPSHALLVASGNAICGNSAIAAVASVTGARREETASAVAYTALLSLALVLLLPFVREWLSLGDLSYGIVTGLTVYAVPQVLAAAYPVSVQAGQVGTMVKLVRVLMLIPLVTGISLHRRRQALATGATLSLRGLVPWYVLGFLVATVTRSSGLVSDAVAGVAQLASHALTIVAMAALGLGVEMELLRRVGWRTAATATVSLLSLAALATLVVIWVPRHGL